MAAVAGGLAATTPPSVYAYSVSSSRSRSSVGPTARSVHAVAAGRVGLDVPKRMEGDEDLLDALDALRGAPPCKGAGELGGRGRAGQSGEQVAQRGDLRRERLRPRPLFRGARRLRLGREVGPLMLRRHLLRRLVVRAKPAHVPLRLLGSALPIERDEWFEDRLVGEVSGPAVSGGHGLVEVIVEATAR